MKRNCKVGYVYLGGCGENTLHDLVNTLDPKCFAEVYFFAANTDKSLHDSLFENDEADSQLARWKKDYHLETHVLGEDHPETRGWGAGGDPEVGKRATQTEKSYGALHAFITKMDEIVIVTGAGGGTGTGAMQVVAEICQRENKAVLAIVVTPFAEEGGRRVKRAKEALEVMYSMVPTIAIRNDHLSKYSQTLSEEEKGKLVTFKDKRTLVTRHGTLPILYGYQEIAQVPGDGKNLDRNDHRATLRHGNYVVVSMVKGSREAMLAKSAEEIVGELLTLHFQDEWVIRQAVAGEMWLHGPIGDDVLRRSMLLIEDVVCTGRPGVKEEFEIQWGQITNTPAEDDEVWIWLLLVAKEPPPLEVPKEEPLQAAPRVEGTVATPKPEPEKENRVAAGPKSAVKTAKAATTTQPATVSSEIKAVERMPALGNNRDEIVAGLSRFHATTTPWPERLSSGVARAGRGMMSRLKGLTHTQGSNNGSGPDQTPEPKPEKSV